jgi:hypothetical protein
MSQTGGPVLWWRPVWLLMAPSPLSCIKIMPSMAMQLMNNMGLKQTNMIWIWYDMIGYGYGYGYGHDMIRYRYGYGNGYHRIWIWYDRIWIWYDRIWFDMIIPENMHLIWPIRGWFGPYWGYSWAVRACERWGPTCATISCTFSLSVSCWNVYGFEMSVSVDFKWIIPARE